MSSNYKKLYSISNRHNFSKCHSFKENFVNPNDIREDNIMVQQRSYNKDDPNMYNQQNLYPRVNPNYTYIENQQKLYPKVNPNYTYIENLKEKEQNENKSEHAEITYETTDHYNISSPQIFGPPLWFSLHNASAHYPINPSPITSERMKNIILGIPVLLPCKNCSEHATAYIEKNFEKLNDICSTRDNLFKFFVDFHNYVNIRYNKPVMSYEDAYKMYSGNVKINKMSYTA